MSYQDSNLEFQNQNLTCYHYTIAQSELESDGKDTQKTGKSNFEHKNSETVKKDSLFLAIFAAMRKWLVICGMLLCAALPPAARVIRASLEAGRTCAILRAAPARNTEEARHVPLFATPPTGVLAATGSPENPDHRHDTRLPVTQTAPTHRPAAALRDLHRLTTRDRYDHAQPLLLRPADRYVFALRHIVI